MRLAVLALVAAFSSSPVLAQAPAAAAPQAVVRIPTPGGEVVLAGPIEQRVYDEVRYAQVRTAGDFVFLSGVIVGPGVRGAADEESFKTGARRAFRLIERQLAAAGVGFADVVEIESFHVWNSPAFTGTRDQHFAAFSAVKDEFMKAPHPAWTAVGTTGLLADDGLVEVKVTAYKRAAR